jgi:hypothetical protein
MPDDSKTANATDGNAPSEDGEHKKRRHLGLKFTGVGFYSIKYEPRDYWPGEITAAEREEAIKSGLYAEQEYPSNMPEPVAPPPDKEQKTDQPAGVTDQSLKEAE